MRSSAQRQAPPAPLAADQPIRGWNILSDSLEDGLRVIERAAAYEINHLQLSHQITHDLQHILAPDRREVAECLTQAAHRAGIQEVVLWDRVFYQLSYYPNRFRSGPGGTLNLDDAAFWDWLKADYRRLLDKAPDIQGIVLTFIETQTRIEKQHSRRLETDSRKIAAVVNALADVIIGERGLNLYARTFSYDSGEYANIMKAVELFERPEIRLMLKEAPHDFFLTHPNNPNVAGAPRPVLIEFDAAGEFNGQGLIANTWPQYILRRGDEFLQNDIVAGYVARTDRYGKTRIIDRPSEINLLALKRGFEERGITAENIYREFIEEHYCPEAFPHLRKAFGNAYDIVTSTLYTLGTNVANHSALNYDPYVSSYARHVSGKWIDPPFVDIGHGVNRRFHYWKDVIEHIAPAWAKAGGAHLHEVPRVVEAGWLTPDEQMNEEWLQYILTEKDYGVRLAEESLDAVCETKRYLPEDSFTALEHHFSHTLLTARLYRATAAAYWGSRVEARGDPFRTDYVIEKTRAGREAISEIVEAIRKYPVKPPSGGQWSWVQDAEQAGIYLNLNNLIQT
jgi:hypothetical protein